MGRWLAAGQGDCRWRGTSFRQRAGEELQGRQRTPFSLAALRNHPLHPHESFILANRTGCNRCALEGGRPAVRKRARLQSGSAGEDAVDVESGKNWQSQDAAVLSGNSAGWLKSAKSSNPRPRDQNLALLLGMRTQVRLPNPLPINEPTVFGCGVFLPATPVLARFGAICRGAPPHRRPRSGRHLPRLSLCVLCCTGERSPPRSKH